MYLSCWSTYICIFSSFEYNINDHYNIMWKKKDSHMFKYYDHIYLVTLNKLQMTCVGEGKKKISCWIDVPVFYLGFLYNTEYFMLSKTGLLEIRCLVALKGLSLSQQSHAGQIAQIIIFLSAKEKWHKRLENTPFLTGPWVVLI